MTKWVQSREWFAGPLALSGHSKGGYSVARYAEEYSHEVALLVPVAPVVSGKLSFEAYRMKDPEEFEKWKRDGVLIVESTDGYSRVQHWYQMEERLNHDLLPKANRLDMPTLLIVGSNDTSCRPEHVEMLFHAIPEGRKTLKIIEGAPHSYYEKSEQDACKNFIKEWLGSVER